MPAFKIIKDCLGKEAGDFVVMTVVRAKSLMESGYVEKDKNILKPEIKEQAVSKKAITRKKAIKQDCFKKR